MCFTPLLSLFIAIIEFFLATAMLLFFRKTKLRNFFALFIYLLGIYQFTEYMLCSGDIEFWGKIGFITYTFLPALYLQGILRYLRIKIREILLYVVPIIFAFFAAIIPGFIIGGKCYGPVVGVKVLLFQPALNTGLIASLIYWTYYFGFLLAGCYLLYRDYIKQKNYVRKEIDILGIIGFLSMFVPTVMLIIIFPALSSMFPSILCKFAFLLAITAFVGAYLDSRLPH